jgi:hypothetical protein
VSKMCPFIDRPPLALPLTHPCRLKKQQILHTS